METHCQLVINPGAISENLLRERLQSPMPAAELRKGLISSLLWFAKSDLQHGAGGPAPSYFETLISFKHPSRYTGDVFLAEKRGEIAFRLALNMGAEAWSYILNAPRKGPAQQRRDVIDGLQRGAAHEMKFFNGGGDHYPANVEVTVALKPTSNYWRYSPTSPDIRFLEAGPDLKLVQKIDSPKTVAA